MVYTDLCSFYFSVFDEHAVDMTLKEFVKLLRGERWKVQVEEYQRLKASGRETEAKKLKRKLAALVIAGRCDGSHAETNLKQWSGDAMLDVDKCNGRVSEFLQVLKDTPWVKAAWRSVSYDGLKLVVRVEAESVDEYRMAYALVAWHVAQLLAFPCDMSCKNPTRPCFASYDPEAFFRPDTEVFPWRRFVTEHPDRVGEILAELKVKTPASASKPPVAASGMLHTFFNEFLEQNPFVDGKKNEFLLKLGRIARYKGVGEEELARLKTLAVERLGGEGGGGAGTPRRAGTADAGRGTGKDRPPGGRPQGPRARACACGSQGGGGGGRGRGTRGRRGAWGGSVSPWKSVRPFARLFEAWVDARPQQAREGYSVALHDYQHQRLPAGVRMNYGGMVYSADLYLVALAGSGRGKGVMQLAAILPAAIQEYYDELNRKDEREYRQKLLKWNLEERLAAQEKRVPDLDQCPEMPVERILKVAPNISKSQLILALEAGGAVGLVMNASELDMISSAMHQEYGKHDDVMRAASQHEEVSSYFKTDHRLVVVSDPHLALCASGTPAQLHKFISSLENGMYSRVAFYVGQAPGSISRQTRQGPAGYARLFQRDGRGAAAYVHLSLRIAYRGGFHRGTMERAYGAFQNVSA